MKTDELIAEVTRRGVFFIENKETHRWVIPRYACNFDGDHQTSDPHKAERFGTILEALMTMKAEDFKMAHWTVTEHEFLTT